MFEGICDAIHRELDELEQKFESGAKMNAQELEHIDKMAHALKSIATYDAMKGHSEYDGGSYMRGRSRTTGRYISRDGYDPRDGGSYERRY